MIFKSEKGQAMVEFALLLLPLLLIIGGIVDFGWIFHQQVLANNASREAARHVAIYYNIDNAVKSNPTTAAKNAVYDELPSYIKTYMATDTLTDFTVGPTPITDKVVVTIAWETDTFFPFFSKIGPFTIDSTTVMKLER
ncbi:MAG: TadE family protein [Haloplasmataceae bacterium]|jgi:Flp pilus assembly protein TadG|nr:TadE family protein [Haloplasmataceae bacterium]